MVTYKLPDPTIMEMAHGLMCRLSEIEEAVRRTSKRRKIDDYRAAQSTCGLRDYRGHQNAADQVLAIRGDVQDRKKLLQQDLEPYSLPHVAAMDSPENMSLTAVEAKASEMVRNWERGR